MNAVKACIAIAHSFLDALQVAELPKSLVPQLMEACHSVLCTDSEENGMVVQRVLFDMHKAYKQALEEHSRPFFTWLQQVFVVSIWGNCCHLDPAQLHVL